jgi:hypothetical protein
MVLVADATTKERRRDGAAAQLKKEGGERGRL